MRGPSLALAGSLLAGLLLAPDERARPPGQPAGGPGGSSYAHASWRAFHVAADAEDEPSLTWWEPRDPAPAKAPVIVFLHGWCAFDPATYGAWIEHLVRRGNIVLWPEWQRSPIALPRTFVPELLTATRSGFGNLRRTIGVQPDLERVAYVGHSMGGLLASLLAARAEAAGLPAPRAVFCVQPGLSVAGNGTTVMPDADAAAIPPGTLLVTLAGDVDSITGDFDARRIVREASRVSAADKAVLLLGSDDHGRPALDGDHFAPCGHDERFHPGGERGFIGRQLRAAFPVDALDWYGLWKPFDELCAQAFGQRPRDGALFGKSQEREMGRWSDGTAVRALELVAP
jgi:acetyl esterase/lipase